MILTTRDRETTATQILALLFEGVVQVEWDNGVVSLVDPWNLRLCPTVWGAPDEGKAESRWGAETDQLRAVLWEAVDQAQERVEAALKKPEKRKRSRKRPRPQAPRLDGRRRRR